MKSPNDRYRLKTADMPRQRIAAVAAEVCFRTFSTKAAT
jgi:hypothetical protein